MSCHKVYVCVCVGGLGLFCYGLMNVLWVCVCVCVCVCVWEVIVIWVFHTLTQDCFAEENGGSSSWWPRVHRFPLMCVAQCMCVCWYLPWVQPFAQVWLAWLVSNGDSEDGGRTRHTCPEDKWSVRSTLNFQADIFLLMSVSSGCADRDEGDGWMRVRRMKERGKCVSLLTEEWCTDQKRWTTPPINVVAIIELKTLIKYKKKSKTKKAQCYFNIIDI